MENILSVDVEQWYHRQILKPFLKNTRLDNKHIIKGINKILEIFKKYGVTSTFFALGKVAETIPEVVERIHDEGHEIAYHGYNHDTLNVLSKEKFEIETRKGVKLLEKITQEKIRGFRSPMFSLSKNTSWALDVLVQHEFEYDSSIQPAITKFGSPQSSPYPYFPNFDIPSKIDKEQNKIIELPVLTQKLGKWSIPAGGGFYLRALGPSFVLNALKKMNKNGHPAMLYIHPWEISGFPELEMPFWKKAYSYHGISALKHFEFLVKRISIKPAREIIENYVK